MESFAPELFKWLDKVEVESYEAHADSVFSEADDSLVVEATFHPIWRLRIARLIREHAEADVAKLRMELWGMDEIQFPRLLAEIMANVELDDDMLRPVADSMDVELSDVLELFDRAQEEWERIKARVVPVS